MVKKLNIDIESNWMLVCRSNIDYLVLLFVSFTISKSIDKMIYFCGHAYVYRCKPVNLDLYSVSHISTPQTNFLKVTFIVK